MKLLRTLLSLLMALCLSILLLAQTDPKTPIAATPEKRPLSALPYSPSLDVTSMDKSVDPCVDFYSYSCRGWIKKNPIPADQASWDVYGKLTDENQQYLWGLLQAAGAPSAQRTASEQKIGDYFSSCMDEAAINRLGATPLKPELDAIAATKSLDQLA